MSYADSASLLALAVIFMDLNTILISLRLVTIRMKRKSLNPDDYSLLVSWLLGTLMCIIMITAVAYKAWGESSNPPLNAFGYPDMSKTQDFINSNVLSAKFFYAQEILLILQLAASKITILLFYRRALVPERRGFTHWATLITMVVIGLWSISFFFAYTFQCGTHFFLVWDLSPTSQLAAEKICISSSIEIIFPITDVILDLTIFAIPFYRISQLHLSTPKKVQVAGAFTIGALSVMGAIIRLAALSTIGRGDKNSFTDLTNTSPDSILMFWAMLESGFALTTATLPGIRPLINKVAKAFDRQWSSIMSSISTRNESARSESAASTASWGSIHVKRDIVVQVSRA